MTPQEMLLDCLAYYEIQVNRVENNLIFTIKDYEIEVEKNGLYKLKQSGAVIAPFDNLDALCQFILSY